MLTPVTIPAQTFIQITTGSDFDANKGAVGIFLFGAVSSKKRYLPTAPFYNDLFSI